MYERWCFVYFLSICCFITVAKKVDLALFKNWRPVALLTTEYKIFSKCLSNRLKNYLEMIVHRDQSYCVPKRSIMDHLFLVRDILDICKAFNMNVGLVLLDQEKAFDHVDHDYLFNVLKVFGFGDKFVKLIQLLYSILMLLLWLR